MPPFFVREMTLDDLDAVLELFDRVAGERRWIGTEPGYDRQKYRDIFGRAIDLGNAMFVAESGGRVAGMLTTYRHEEYGWTLGMLVDEQWRGAGLGRALLERLIEWAKMRDVRRLSLLVFPHNERALRLYRSMGFEEVERYEADVRRQSGEVWDTLLMCKTIE